ncbi:hypothetical protein [Actinocatenispora comari]|uniref:Uncharacterized protein n=1 Tax=Actinocatenispora comari TaxID=2807577 RepID=A0A8J4EPR8_9ACTN|nr:hypothetical protein [Actinocatenispora comari]GIL29019.1 hypothetical protein NUM_42730 [Actinocatenispora comari]
MSHILKFFSQNSWLPALLGAVVGYIIKVVVDNIQQRTSRRREDRMHFRDRRMDYVLDVTEIAYQLEAMRSEYITDWEEHSGIPEQQMMYEFPGYIQELRAKADRPLTALRVLSPELHRAAKAWLDVATRVEPAPNPREDYPELLTLATRTELGDAVTPAEKIKSQRLRTTIYAVRYVNSLRYANTFLKTADAIASDRPGDKEDAKSQDSG